MRGQADSVRMCLSRGNSYDSVLPGRSLLCDALWLEVRGCWGKWGMAEGRAGEWGRRSQITEEFIGHSVKYSFSLKCNRSHGILEEMYIFIFERLFRLPLFYCHLVEAFLDNFKMDPLFSVPTALCPHSMLGVEHVSHLIARSILQYWNLLILHPDLSSFKVVATSQSLWSSVCSIQGTQDFFNGGNKIVGCLWRPKGVTERMWTNT